MNVNIRDCGDMLLDMLGKLNISGVENIRIVAQASFMIEAINPILHKLGDEIIKRAEEDKLEQKREERKKQLESAFANGETVVGGQTIRVNGDGTIDKLIS